MTLVVMAAGIGSRFGGIKQLTPLTQENEYIIDFTVYDAVRAGFDDVIFIIRKDIEDAFEKRIGARLRDHGIRFSYAYQENVLPNGYIYPADRTKPFGTVHAILSAGRLERPFAVVNADDFYGYESLRLVADFLKQNDSEWCSVGYRLKNTLSRNGTVSRGICKAESGKLVGITECKKIVSDGTQVYNINGDGSRTVLAMDDLVSMNCFGFNRDFYEKLSRLFCAFLEKNKDDFSTCEFILSEALMQMIEDGAAVRVLDTDSQWCGVTYREDCEVFRSFITEKKNNGEYPRFLWE